MFCWQVRWAASWEQFECVDVARPDDGEVRSVEGEDLLDVESFGDRDWVDA